MQISKDKHYVEDETAAPEEVEIQEGPRGGLYYETDGVRTNLVGGLIGLGWTDPAGISFIVVDQTASGDWVVMRDDGKVYDGVPRTDVVDLATAGSITQAPDDEDDPANDYIGAEWVKRGEVYRVQRSVGLGLYEVKNLSSGAVEVLSADTVEEIISVEDDDGDGVPNDLVGEAFAIGGKQFTVLDVTKDGMALVRGPAGDTELPEDHLRAALQSGKVELVSRNTMKYADLIEKGKPTDFANLYTGAGVAVTAKVEERGNDSVKVKFTLTDPESGRELGKMRRLFNSDGSVEHDTFILAKEFQGRGLAAKLNEKAEESYRAAGISSIYLNADIDVGKYTWALQGYDFEDAAGRDYMRSQLKRFLATPPRVGSKFSTSSGDGEILGIEGSDYLVSLGGDRSLMGANGLHQMLANSDAARFEKLEREHGGLQHSWDFAGLDDGQRHSWKSDSKNGEGHLGKAFLLSEYVHEWDGTKSLDPDSLGYAIGKRYYERGNKPHA